MRPALQAKLEPMLAQVRGNPRLQLGLVLIGVILVGWIFLLLGDIRASRAQALEQARQRLAQVHQLSGQDEWIRRAEVSHRLAAALAAEIPPAQSPGLAQAAFQGWMQQIVDDAPGRVRLDMQPPTRLDAPADVIMVTATATGGLEPQRAWQMIHRIESSGALVRIPAITVRSDGLNKTFSVTVQGFYRLPEPLPPGAVQ